MPWQGFRKVKLWHPKIGGFTSIHLLDAYRILDNRCSAVYYLHIDCKNQMFCADVIVALSIESQIQYLTQQIPVYFVSCGCDGNACMLYFVTFVTTLFLQDDAIT